jgi:hypothetical protein
LLLETGYNPTTSGSEVLWTHFLTSITNSCYLPEPLFFFQKTRWRTQIFTGSPNVASVSFYHLDLCNTKSFQIQVLMRRYSMANFHSTIRAIIRWRIRKIFRLSNLTQARPLFDLLPKIRVENQIIGISMLQLYLWVCAIATGIDCLELCYPGFLSFDNFLAVRAVSLYCCRTEAGEPAKKPAATTGYADPASITSGYTVDITFVIIAPDEELVTNTFFGSDL